MSWDWDKLKEQQEGKGDKINPPKKKKFKNIPEWVSTVMWITGYAILWGSLVFGFWHIARWVNFKYSYQPKMQEAIIEMVKPEALKDKYRKE